MTDDELQRLADAATPGPWRAIPGNWEFHECVRDVATDHLLVTSGHDGGDPNLSFIAAAREAVPRLLARQRMVVEALTSEDEIAHGEAWDDVRKRGLGDCAYCGVEWPCRTQRGINRLLAALAPKDTP